MGTEFKLLLWASLKGLKNAHKHLLKYYCRPRCWKKAPTPDQKPVKTLKKVLPGFSINLRPTHTTGSFTQVYYTNYLTHIQKYGKSYHKKKHSPIFQAIWQYSEFIKLILNQEFKSTWVLSFILSLTQHVALDKWVSLSRPSFFTA